MGRLFLLFTLTPVIELYLLLKVGSLIGAVPTVGLVLLTGFVGAALARREGTKALADLMDTTRRGALPHAALFDAVAVFIGGALLLTPGIVTDAVGVLLLIPQTRRHARGLAQRWFRRHVVVEEVVVGPGTTWSNSSSGHRSSPLSEDRIYDDRLR